MTDLINELRAKFAAVTAERDEMLRRIGANETAQLLTQAVQKQCEETLRWKEKAEQADADAKASEMMLRQVCDERDAAKAICQHSTGSAIHAITCVHHTDAERAALPVHGNCPICAANRLAYVFAELTAERTARKALQAALSAYVKATYCNKEALSALELAAKLPA